MTGVLGACLALMPLPALDFPAGGRTPDRAGPFFAAYSSTSFTVQRLVTKAIAATAYKRDYAVNVPTISMGWL